MGHYTLIARINAGGGKFPFVNVQFTKNHRRIPIEGATYYLIAVLRDLAITSEPTGIPRDLIASELFGHGKGAFTGATQQRLGRFELASGGTIFSTKSENFQTRLRSPSCVFCRSMSLSASAALVKFALTFG